MRKLFLAAFLLPAFLLPALPVGPGVVLGVGPMTVAAAAEEGRFVAEISDLPLMPGLTELSDTGVVFDKPEGRIVEAYASGAVSREAVLAFYGDSLPQLGWLRAREDRFTRDGEALSIEVLEDARPLTLRFTLRPE